METMNGEYFKAMLTDVLNEANLSQLNEIKTLRLVNENIPDENELASTETDKQFDLRLKSREATYIKKVKEALRRIDEGTFGECVECGNEIGFTRLLARPTAHLCIGCKEEQERSERGTMENKGSPLLNVIPLKQDNHETMNIIKMDGDYNQAVNF